MQRLTFKVFFRTAQASVHILDSRRLWSHFKLTQRMKKKNLKTRCFRWMNLRCWSFLWMNQIHFVFNLLWFSWMSSVLCSLSSRYAWSNRFALFTTLHKRCLSTFMFEVNVRVESFENWKFSFTKNANFFIHRLRVD